MNHKRHRRCWMTAPPNFLMKKGFSLQRGKYKRKKRMLTALWIVFGRKLIETLSWRRIGSCRPYLLLLRLMAVQRCPPSRQTSQFAARNLSANGFPPSDLLALLSQAIRSVPARVEDQHP